MTTGNGLPAPPLGGARATMNAEELKRQIYLGVKPGLPKLTATATLPGKLPPLEATAGAQDVTRIRSTLASLSIKADSLPEPLQPHQSLQPLPARGGAPAAPPLRTTLKRKPEGGVSQSLDIEAMGGAVGASHQSLSLPRGGGHAPSVVSSGAGGAHGAAAPAAPGKSLDDYSYVKLIQTLRQYPSTDDFVYLRRADRDPSIYNPYALDVVPFALVDTRDFYTLSSRGLIHVVDGANAEFTGLDQWERELQLYTALKRLRVFALFKLWKSFRLWRRALRQRKVSDAKSTLQKNLFLLSPVFQGLKSANTRSRLSAVYSCSSRSHWSSPVNSALAPSTTWMRPREERV